MRTCSAIVLGMLVWVIASVAGVTDPGPGRTEAGSRDDGWVRSAHGGAWSDPAIWEGGAVPGAGAKVQIRPGHAVVYDVDSDRPIRSVCVGGTLSFAADKDTRLDVGLIKV